MIYVQKATVLHGYYILSLFVGGSTQNQLELRNTMAMTLLKDLRFFRIPGHKSDLSVINF